MMERTTEISMPITKAGTAIGAAAAAKAEVAEQVARHATSNSTYETWMAINSIPWGTIASMAAAAYTLLLITEWFWKKLWRPLFERRGWVKPRRTRIISVEEFESETDRGAL